MSVEIKKRELEQERMKAALFAEKKEALVDSVRRVLW